MLRTFVYEGHELVEVRVDLAHSILLLHGTLL